TRFGEQLTPDLLAAQRTPGEAIALPLRAPRAQRGDAHAEPDLEDAARHGIMRFLLVVDHLLDRACAAPAPFLGPGDASVAGVRLRRLPLLGLLAKLGAFTAGAIEHRRTQAARRGMGLEEGAHPSPERGLVRRVVKIHGSRPCSRTERSRFRAGRSDVPASAANCRAPARATSRGDSRGGNRPPR